MGRAVKNDRIGEQRLNNQGLRMTIIEYRGCNDVTIRFDDGTLVHSSMTRFKSGSIGYPKNIKDRVGETTVNNNKCKATIIEYISSTNVVVRFEDGAISRTTYDQFKKGCFAHPKDKKEIKCTKNMLGATKICENGIVATIIGYRTSRDIDVELSDGRVIKNTHFKTFKAGTFKRCRMGKEQRPLTDNDITKYITMKCGLMVHIKDYISKNDLTAEFEDGSIVSHAHYISLEQKCLRHPKYSNCEYVGAYGGEKLFLCTCRTCKGKHVLKLSEMKNFECTYGEL